MTNDINLAFKAIIQNPLDFDHWGLFDLYVIQLVREEGMSFINDLKLDKQSSKSFIVEFPLNHQLEILNVEIKRNIDLFDMDFVQRLTVFREYLKESTVVDRFRVYDVDYFVIKGQKVSYALTNNPLLNIKIEHIIERRQRNYFDSSE